MLSVFKGSTDVTVVRLLAGCGIQSAGKEVKHYTGKMQNAGPKGVNQIQRFNNTHILI